MTYVICHIDPKTGRERCGTARLPKWQADLYLATIAVTMPGVEHWLKAVG
jgi:hypothetical protein